MARDIFDQLTKEWQPKIRKAFLESVNKITSNVTIKAVAAELERGDIEAALRAVGLEDFYFNELAEQIRQTFTAGGEGTAKLVPTVKTASGSAVKFFFDARDPQAEQWLTQHSGKLIREIVYDQRDMIRTHLREGLVRGDNPTTTARDLVGRISRATGRREGGIIGLTSRQEEWQRSYADELASSDPKELKKALNRGLRDKRFDRSIAKAIREGKPLPKDVQDKARLAYRNRSLKYRADAIGRTETAQSLGQSHKQAWDQAIARGQVKREDLLKFPKYIHDGKARQHHRDVAEMNKDGVPWDQPYQVPEGMAPQMHAPYDEPLCRCRETVRVVKNG